MTFTRNGNDPTTIEVAGQSGTLTIQNWFLGPSYQIGSFVLANGTAVTPDIVVQGTSGDDTLVAGPYETLLGGAGNDTYVFDRGSGPTTIFDNATTTQTVTTTSKQLVWSGDVGEYSIVFWAAAFNFNDPVITSRTPVYSYDGYGNRTGIAGYDDSVLGYRTSTQTTTQTVQASGGANTLQFGAGISVSDLEVQASGNDLIIGVKDPGNPNLPFAQLTDKITLQDWVNPLNQVQTFRFADGTTLNVAGIQALIGLAEAPALSVQPATGIAGEPITLSLTTTAIFSQDTLSLRVAGLPSGSTLSAGTQNADGSWSLTPAQLNDLTLTTPPEASLTGTVDLTVTSTETAPNGSTASTSSTLAVNIAPPTVTVIESSGSTRLTQVDNEFYLYNSNGVGPLLKEGGPPVVAGEFGSGWTPIGAEQTATGYEVAWKDGSGNYYSVWSVDSNGNYIANVIGAVSGTSFALEAFESSFHQDLNGDGTLGPPGMTVIETDGSTWLTQVGTQYYLYNSSGSGPKLQFAGSPVLVGQFGAGVVPIGAEQTATGYEVAWKAAGDQYGVWATDANGNYVSTVVGTASGSSFAMEVLEPSFQQDFNGDGVIGPPGMTVIETAGSTWLTQINNEYYLYNSSGVGPVLTLGGSPVVVGEFGSGWAPIGAEQTASGYEVALKDSSGDYTVWSVDSNGNYVSNIGAVSGTSSALEELEPSFHQDLNGDGVVGPPTGAPVFLGLDGNGINVVPLSASTAQFDMTGSGTPVSTAWAGAGDGILAIDLGADGSLNPDGVIDQAKEIEFTAWAPGTTSDMAALEQVFDTNHDGMLDSGDADWGDLRVWVDSNGVGSGQLYTLGQLGITSINLQPSGPAQTLADGSVIQGTSSYTMADGTTGVAGDVSLAYDPSALSGASAPTPILLSNGTSADAGVAQLINALAAQTGQSSGVDPTTIMPPPDQSTQPTIAVSHMG